MVLGQEFCEQVQLPSKEVLSDPKSRHWRHQGFSTRFDCAPKGAPAPNGLGLLSLAVFSSGLGLNQTRPNFCTLRG